MKHCNNNSSINALLFNSINSFRAFDNQGVMSGTHLRVLWVLPTAARNAL